MVERSRRGKGKQKLLGSHQRCWIWGRNVVLETLRAGRWPILELHLSDRFTPAELQSARELAAGYNVDVSIASTAELSRRCRSAEHQGYVAKMPPFPYDDVEQLLRTPPERPLYAILDSIQDPYNFGAIIRSAEVLGVDAVFVGSARQAEVTSLVARSSAGAVNHIPIARVENLVALVETLQTRSVQIVGASEKGETNLYDFDLRRPTAIIIGNEGTGILADLLDRCDRLVSIPQFGHVPALNAAVAAGILFYEAHRQRAAGEE